MSTFQLVGRFLNAHGSSKHLDDKCALGEPKGTGTHFGEWVQSMIAIEIEALRYNSTLIVYLSVLSVGCNLPHLPHTAHCTPHTAHYHR